LLPFCANVTHVTRYTALVCAHTLIAATLHCHFPFAFAFAPFVLFCLLIRWLFLICQYPTTLVTFAERYVRVSRSRDLVLVTSARYTRTTARSGRFAVAVPHYLFARSVRSVLPRAHRLFADTVTVYCYTLRFWLVADSRGYAHYTAGFGSVCGLPNVCVFAHALLPHAAITVYVDSVRRGCAAPVGWLRRGLVLVALVGSHAHVALTR